MNDIEKMIEGKQEDDVISIDKEDDTIKGKLNRNSDDEKKKKVIIWCVIGILLLVLVGLIVIIVLDNGDNDVDTNNSDVVNGDSYEPASGVEDSNIGYVSCDDNADLLNVRNSTEGNIIDGLSCYKMVTIEEELDGTAVCDKWYKISYDRNGSNYTGYSCGTYIKKLEVSENVLNNVRELVDKALDYYQNSVLKAYCGNSDDVKMIEFDNNMVGEYVKSEYKNIDELKGYLYSFLDKSLVKVEPKLSDYDKKKYYDDYYEIDGSLYCRNYSGKGWITYYTGNYDIEITNYNDNIITANIAYQYVNENVDCALNDISSCGKNDFVYDIGEITIRNGIITNMEFYK